MQTKRLLSRALASAAGVLAVAVLAVGSPSQAGKPWHSVTADLHWQGECFTTSTTTADPNNPGGVSCFNKTVFIPRSANVLRITWSTTGDTHFGAAMELACLITDGAGTTTFCQTGFGADFAPAGWLTALKLPAGGGATNCGGGFGDGGGGDADCHDNSIHYEWCVQIPGDDVYTIDLRIGSDAGGTVFTEKSTFFIDSSKLGENDCVQRFPPGFAPDGA